MFFEDVHLYTYDLFAEKLGFKLSWGCLCFYPFFYGIGGYALINAEKPLKMSKSQCLICVIVFFTGWVITRGANLQKHSFRVNPEKKVFRFGTISVKQECITGTQLLCSGWWSSAKHFNYFGEILQGLALAIPCLFVGGQTAVLGMLYPLYYCALFIPRQIDDDLVCKVKYGEKWDAYCKVVKYRIVPGLY